MSITFNKYCKKEGVEPYRTNGSTVVQLDNIWDDPTGSMPYDITIRGNRNEFQETINKFNTYEDPLYVRNLSINDFDIENFNNNVSKINSYFYFDQISVHNCKIKYLSYQVESDGYFINCDMKGAYFDRCAIGRHSQFRDCDLSNATFENCIMGCGYDPILFTKCNMNNVQMQLKKDSLGGYVESIQFTESNMEGMDLTSCEFSNTNLVIENCNTNGIKVDRLKVRSLDSDNNFRKKFIFEGGVIGDASIEEKITYEFYHNKFGMDL
jgi:uncharacterized protein YjbI with pentapeptide repeats